VPWPHENEVYRLRALHASTEGALRDELQSVAEERDRQTDYALKSQAAFQRERNAAVATEGALRQVVERLQSQAERMKHGAGESRVRAHRLLPAVAASIQPLIDAIDENAGELQEIATELSALLAFPLGGERKT
jgi:hypothetical protein